MTHRAYLDSSGSTGHAEFERYAEFLRLETDRINAQIEARSFTTTLHEWVTVIQPGMTPEAALEAVHSLIYNDFCGGTLYDSIFAHAAAAGDTERLYILTDGCAPLVAEEWRNTPVYWVGLVHNFLPQFGKSIAL